MNVNGKRPNTNPKETTKSLKEKTMGLDQWLYVRRDGEDTVEIAYWRKHPNLHGLMHSIWTRKGKPNAGGDDEFNTIPLFLDEQDINFIEDVIINRNLPETSGFFFGKSKVNTEQDMHDLEVFSKAKVMLKLGYEVYYNSWW